MHFTTSVFSNPNTSSQASPPFPHDHYLSSALFRMHQHPSPFYFYFFKFFLPLLISLIGCTRSQLQHTGSSAFTAAHRIFSWGMQTLSCGMWDLFPCPGIEPGLPAFEVQSLSHWTTREVPVHPVKSAFFSPEDPNCLEHTLSLSLVRRAHQWDRLSCLVMTDSPRPHGL